MEMKLHHHIYTTVGGYRSVYTSEGISPELLALLERYSALTYPKVGGLPIFAISPVGRQFLLYSKAFRGGVDHVGRPKACVHNIVVPLTLPSDDGVARIPTLLEDSLFLSHPPEPSDIPYLPSRLKEEAPAEELVTSVEEVVQTGDFLKPTNLALLLAATASQEFFITGGFIALRQRIRTIFPLIPRPSRLLLTLSNIEAPVDAVFGNRGGILRCIKETSEAPTNAPIIMLDTDTSYNMPAMNRYCTYISESRNRDEIVRLVLLIERYAPRQPLTFDLYPVLIEGFESVKETIDAEGRPEVKHHTIRALMLSLRHFVSCGFYDFVIDALLGVGRFLSRHYDDDSVLANLPQVQHHLKDAEVPLSDKLNQTEILANWVINSIKD